MSRPEDISEGAWETVRAILALHTYSEQPAALARAIDRAILAERERCAKIAEEDALIVQPLYEDAALNEITDDLETQCRETIAAAIRKPANSNFKSVPHGGLVS